MVDTLKMEEPAFGQGMSPRVAKSPEPRPVQRRKRSNSQPTITTIRAYSPLQNDTATSEYHSYPMTSKSLGQDFIRGDLKGKGREISNDDETTVSQDKSSTDLKKETNETQKESDASNWETSDNLSTLHKSVVANDDDNKESKVEETTASTSQIPTLGVIEKEQSADSPIPPTPPPKSPRPQQYSLPIGGGPKKVVILPPIRNSTSSAASSSGTSNRAASMPTTGRGKKKNSKHSPVPVLAEKKLGHSKSQGSIKKAPSSPTSPTDKSLRHSLSSKRTKNKMNGSAFGYEKPGLNVANGKEFQEEPQSRRRALSASHADDTLESSPEVPARRKRASTYLGNGEESGSPKGLRNTRPQTAPPLPFGTLESSSPIKRRLTTSSVLMVEGQMFEIDDGADEKANRQDKPLEKTSEDEEVASMVDHDQDEDEGDGTVMVYSEDEIDDVPPPGAYAIHPPSKFRLAKAAELPIYDEDGKIVEFGTIFSERRTLICFLRHWLCPFCQMFSQSLQSIDPLPLEKANLGLVVIGQGHWHVTKSYKEVMKIPNFVQMYSDPSRKIYKALGMTLRTNDAGPACTRPDYQTMGVFKASMVAMKKGIFDMPLRPPGDLMLLGGEFILGPGLQCSFTHRMVTTRGHLDLPRVLVQAGCDLSLKSPPEVLEREAAARKPRRIKSVDGITARKIARKIARRNNKYGNGINTREISGPRPMGDRANTLRALSGEHESQQGRTLPRSLAKKRHPPLPDIRNLNISYPMHQIPVETNDEEVANSPETNRRASESAAEGVRSLMETNKTSSNHGHEILAVPPSPGTSPLRVVKEKFATGMVTGFSKTPSTSDMNVRFSRPPRSAQRPPVPTTSSANAYAAATARSAAFLAAGPRPPTSRNGLNTTSTPNLRRDHKNHSAVSIQTIQPQSQTTQRPTTAGTMGTVASTDSGYASAVETVVSSSSINSDLSATAVSQSDVLKSKDMTNNLPYNSPLQQAARQNLNKENGDYHSGSPSSPKFISSSPGLPLSASLSDLSRSKQGPKSPLVSDFGEDTEYKRLDRRLLEQPPTLLQNGHHLNGIGIEDRNLPIGVSDQDQDVGNSHSLSASRSTLALPKCTNGASEEDEDLEKTPIARKISLEPGEEFGANADDQELSSSQYTPNRSSIQPGRSSYNSASTASSTSLHMGGVSTTSTAPPPVFVQNALFAGLPGHEQSTYTPPPPPPSNYLPSARAPMPASNPLFASILAEEAARKSEPDFVLGQNGSNDSHSVKGKMEAMNTSLSNGTLSSSKGMMSSNNSFLDQLDVHDGFQSQQTPSRSASNARSSSGTDFDEISEEGEDEDEEEDDWAPLRAGNNAVPASLSNGQEEHGEQSEDDDSITDASDQSTDDYSDDNENGLDPSHRLSPAELQEYELKQVTNRVSSMPSTTPVLTRPHKIQGKSHLRLLTPGSQPSPRRLDSFAEEEEEAEVEEPQRNDEQIAAFQ